MERLIFDCDNTLGVEGCDVDDGLALLYLLGKGSVQICGITTTFGNSNLQAVHMTTQQLLKDISMTHIPLLKGCPDKHTLDSEAAHFIVDTVNANQNNISILATGSLTNLYAAYLLDNKVFEKISQIVIMGGITEDLIINGKVLNELNFSCDPAAAQCVLANGKNLSVITGNNCLDAFFTKKDFEERLLSSDSASAQYIARKCWYWFENMMSIFNIDGFHNWDVVAAAYLAEPSLFKNMLYEITPNLNDLEKGYLTVKTQSDWACQINLPVIADLKKFTDDVYGAWLNLNLG
ncbi:nucleoside hydrolase [Desulfitibacter alkalitolerans]|uniref:nucleoside hydrolase n=1 Tax=Desulfitibacter alkalitolerans TaxID=264641 RepID=UPI000483D21F|nr:nucleoside hydrolase [Desulfitibacter alkalitolerans]